MAPSPRSKHWCFTLNNYTPQDVDSLRKLGPSVVYLVFGREVGEHGTPHLQCFVSYTTRKALSIIRGEISTRAHFEIARGTPQQAAQYCKKDGDFEEFGKCPGGKGARTDLQQVHDIIKEGGTLRQICEEHFGTFARYERSIRSAINLYSAKRLWVTEVHVYYGATGTGKTKKVYEKETDLSDLYIHPGGPWFDGYMGQAAILFDDFGGSEFKITYLLKLLDRYPMTVPIKGGFVSWIPKRIYITTNLDPTSWYPNAHQEHNNALFRRFTNLQEFYNNSE